MIATMATGFQMRCERDVTAAILPLLRLVEVLYVDIGDRQNDDQHDVGERR